MIRTISSDKGVLKLDGDTLNGFTFDFTPYCTSAAIAESTADALQKHLADLVIAENNADSIGRGRAALDAAAVESSAVIAERPDSVEITSNSKGELSFKVKAYDATVNGALDQAVKAALNALIRVENLKKSAAELKEGK